MDQIGVREVRRVVPLAGEALIARYFETAGEVLCARKPVDDASLGVCPHRRQRCPHISLAVQCADAAYLPQFPLCSLARCWSFEEIEPSAFQSSMKLGLWFPGMGHERERCAPDRLICSTFHGLQLDDVYQCYWLVGWVCGCAVGPLSSVECPHFGESEPNPRTGRDWQV